MLTGDASLIKKMNRSLILSTIIEHKSISRAEIAKVTGLNKATISVQVSELLDHAFIVESQLEHKSLGRRPIMLSINQKAGFALGIDLDKTTITFTLADLSGCAVHTDVIDLPVSNYEVIFDILTQQIKNYQFKCEQTHYGLIGVVLGIHGIVDTNEIIYFVPQHGWKNKNLKKDLENELGINIYIENNANLCSIAEKVYKHHHSNNLLSVSLYSGIGLGFMINGKLLKGYHGYAGEIGHMIIVPNGVPCSCGNSGCWEQYASENSLTRRITQVQQTLDFSFEDILTGLKEQEPTILKEMEHFIEYLSIGLNNLINLYNPEILVVNSELLRLYPNAAEELKAHLTSTISHYSELLVSEFGKKACIMGACALGIQKFLGVSELSLTL
ncbi:ROK family transcriptional regulator [Neobacillus cucumis]|uniref:ROK family transcriptional regulator n=1 Tax=Neobacillus cucumis TaxID=1740721 RepID=UPI00203BE3C6|nr:ROK family transcriptional regulator [Neobacillus cucumis]MCM3725520.1 ROK family transcriptional regulator [Neobacillus cucumis]